MICLETSPFMSPTPCGLCHLSPCSLQSEAGSRRSEAELGPSWVRSPIRAASARHSRTGRPRPGCSSLPCFCLGCLPVQAAFLLPPHLPLFPLGEHTLIFPGPARSSPPLPSLSLSPGNTDLFSPCGSFQGLKMYPGLWMAIFWMCLHVAFPLCDVWSERGLLCLFLFLLGHQFS